MTREPLPHGYDDLVKTYGLAGLPREELFLFCYEKGEYLLTEGQPVETLLYIIEGRVKVSVNSGSGRTLMFCFDGPGDLIGSIEVMKALPGTSNVQAAGPLSCIAVPTAPNMDYFYNNIDFLRHLCIDLSEHFAASSKNAATNILHPLLTRLCSYIAMMAEDGLFCEKLTETSELLGTSYRHLLRCLDELCACGVLQKQARGYRVIDHSELTRLAEDYYS